MSTVRRRRDRIRAQRAHRRQPARPRRLVGAGLRGPGHPRRRGPQRRGDRTGLRQRPVQRLLPARLRCRRRCRSLGLERHGLAVGARPGAAGAPDRRTAGPRCSAATSTSPPPRLDAYAPGDGDAWRALVGAVAADPRAAAGRRCSRRSRRSAARAGLARALGVGELARFARFGLLPVRRMAQEHFRGAGGGLLLAGNAMHTDVGPESTGGGVAGLAAGDAGPGRRLPGAAGRGRARSPTRWWARLRAEGGRLRCAAPGGARCWCADGRRGRCAARRRRAGRGPGRLADVCAPALYLRLVAPEHLPARLLADLRALPVGRRDGQGRLGAVRRRCRGPRRGRAGAGTVHLTPGSTR